MKTPSRLANEFISFTNASPSPFQVVESAKTLLKKHGFKEIHERHAWGDHLPRRGYISRNGSSLIAYVQGTDWKPGGPASLVCTHTDSPCLRLKPVSKRTSEGYLQTGVETYGGGIWHTWFDRDLSLAGRVVLKTSDNKSQDDLFRTRLVKIDRPILRIPTLAIHLDRQEKFEYNKETHLFPIAGLVEKELNKHTSSSRNGVESNAERVQFSALKPIDQRHHPALIRLLAHELEVPASEIVDFELILYDTQPACVGGIENDFIFSGRLDNQMMTFCGLHGLISSLTGTVASPKKKASQSATRVLGMFDHEEIGSLSRQGADSNFLASFLDRLNDRHYSPQNVCAQNHCAASMAKSFLISADMAHAVHPNYAVKYEAEHKPQMNGGVVIKINANARYATSSTGIALLKHWAELAHAPVFEDGDHGETDEGEQKSSHEGALRLGVPLQEFVARNDSPCGGTIGTMLSAKLGVRTIDVGNPQLSMHSIRETCGVRDVDYAVALFASFYSNFEKVNLTFSD